MTPGSPPVPTLPAKAGATAPATGAPLAALACVLGGLALELPSVVETTPATFLVFAVAGLPLIAAGATIFLVRVWRVLVKGGVL